MLLSETAQDQCYISSKQLPEIQYEGFNFFQ